MMNYEGWAAEVAEEIKADSLWRMTAYRLALFLSDLGWRDTAKLVRNRLFLTMIPQQRGRGLREQAGSYELEPEQDDTLRALLQDVPLPNDV